MRYQVGTNMLEVAELLLKYFKLPKSQFHKRVHPAFNQLLHLCLY